MTAPTRPVAPEISVVVPTAGGPFLDGCLKSIEAGTLWPARLILVDQSGGSADEWAARLRTRGLDVLHVVARPRGISAAMNEGLARVSTRYVAVTHDDCRVRGDWLERMVARLTSANDQIVTGRVEPEGEGIVLTIKTAGEPVTYAAPLLDGDVLFPPNMGFPVRLLEVVGEFDEHPSLATAGEDNEWAHRALRAGVSIEYAPEIVVRHLARHGRQDLPSLYARYARGQGAFYGTWLRRGDAFIAARAARDLVRAPWLLLRGLVTGNSDLLAMARGELTGLLPGLVAGLGNPGVRSVVRRGSPGRPGG